MIKKLVSAVQSICCKINLQNQPIEVLSIFSRGISAHCFHFISYDCMCGIYYAVASRQYSEHIQKYFILNIHFQITTTSMNK